MNSIILDAQILAQLELDQYIWQQAAVIAPELEIDAVRDMDLGLLYRVWFGIKLLGYATLLNGGNPRTEVAYLCVS